MGLQGCLWGPHTFLVGGSQEGLYPANSDLPPGLLNLNRCPVPGPHLSWG